MCRICTGHFHRTPTSSIVENLPVHVVDVMHAHASHAHTYVHSVQTDETGFSNKEEAVCYHGVYKKGTKYPGQRVQNSRDHTTVTVGVRAEGQSCHPAWSSRGSCPSPWMGQLKPHYSSSEAGFMMADLFLDYLKKGIEPYLDCPRPCVLFMDNALVHRSIDIASFCLDNCIIPVLLPPNTTQILQPVDQCSDPPHLRKKMAYLMHTAGILQPESVLGRVGSLSFCAMRCQPFPTPWFRPPGDTQGCSHLMPAGFQWKSLAWMLWVV